MLMQCDKNADSSLQTCKKCINSNKENSCQPLWGEVLNPLRSAISEKRLAECTGTCTDCKERQICSNLVLYDVSFMDVLQDMENKANKHSVTRIVLTGGPCAGKSTGISKIEQILTNRGYKVFVLEEIASLLINSGAAPWVIGNREFQKAVVRMYLERDKIYDDIIKEETKPTVILYDRGLMDSMAYIDKISFLEILEELGVTLSDIRDRYNGVFNLVSAANGAPEFYTLENNKARSEGVELAVELDDKLQKAWTGHSHLRILPNVVNGKQIGFEEKIGNLLKEVFTLMGIPLPMEIERKFLIQYPNVEELSKRFGAVRVDIVQSYLESKDTRVERRVRQRGIDNGYSYYYTEKVNQSNISRPEREEKITQDEYLALLSEADTSLHQIRKQRYCFLYEGKYLELDIYPAWKDKAILEIELSSEDEEFKIPVEFIKVIKEVTEDDRYKNNSLAKSFDID